MFTHYPVFHREIIQLIKNHNPSLVIDFTFGLGGHSRLILQNTNCQLIAIDLDPNVMPWVEKLQQEFPHRFRFINKKFSDGLDQLIEEGIKARWILGDFGLSSMQIDDGSRGFSFTNKGPINMAMDGIGNRCNYLINESSITELAHVIKKYGEERNYYNITKNIVSHRPINDTHQLRKAIESQVFDKKFLNKSLARVFQAIRIYTNNELEEINYLLKNIYKISDVNTGFSWIYFHSLEAHEVHQWSKGFKYCTKKVYKPSEKELEENSRSRCAEMVVVV